MFRLRRTFPERERFAGVSAYHLYTWYENNHFCGKCGKELLRNENERKLQCPECGNEVFPRINPAVIVAVSHGDELILTNYAGREYKKYALIAGFAEFGETIEQTVQREVMEEPAMGIFRESAVWLFCRGRRRPYDLQAGRRISGGNVGAGRRDCLRYRGDQPDKRNDAGVSKRAL